jgi:hypothetical protein
MRVFDVVCTRRLLHACVLSAALSLLINYSLTTVCGLNSDPCACSCSLIWHATLPQVRSIAHCFAHGTSARHVPSVDHRAVLQRDDRQALDDTPAVLQEQRVPRDWTRQNLSRRCNQSTHAQFVLTAYANVPSPSLSLPLPLSLLSQSPPASPPLQRPTPAARTALGIPPNTPLYLFSSALGALQPADHTRAHVISRSLFDTLH